MCVIKFVRSLQKLFKRILENHLMDFTIFRVSYLCNGVSFAFI